MDGPNKPCPFGCTDLFPSLHDLIRHHMVMHCVVSGSICPYCDGCKKFDDVDAHVNKYHLWDRYSPIQDCKVCRLRLSNYEDLKKHRQIHDKKQVEVIRVGDAGADQPGGGGGSQSVMVHSRVGALTDIGNRGGVKCTLCSTFKLRRDHLYMHYIKHHG